MSAPEALGRHRAAIDAAMREAVARLDPLVRPTVSYHLGWSDAGGRETGGDGGKGIRPVLAILACEAVGGTLTDGLPGAVAVELVHNFSLLHDDVMDGDAERRHRPTAWALFGVPHAIVAGDALLPLAHAVLLEGSGERGARALTELVRATGEMIAGQAEDLSFEARLDVSEADSARMSRRKTGALIACANALGAILGGADDPAVAALREFGEHLGLAFQAVDDLLGIWGEPSVTGKPAANDLRQRKKSLPVAHALSTPGAGERLRQALSAGGEVGEVELEAALAALEEAGSRAWTQRVADEHLARALETLGAAPLAARPSAELRAVARFVARREF